MLWEHTMLSTTPPLKNFILQGAVFLAFFSHEFTTFRASHIRGTKYACLFSVYAQLGILRELFKPFLKPQLHVPTLFLVIRFAERQNGYILYTSFEPVINFMAVKKGEAVLSIYNFKTSVIYFS